MLKINWIYLSFWALILCCTVPIKAQTNSKETATSEQTQQHFRMEIKNERLPQTLKRLEKMTGYKISFSYEDLNNIVINQKVNARNVNTALRQIIGSHPVTYVIDDKIITVTLKRTSHRQANVQQQSPTVLLRGRVVDIDDESLPSVHIALQPSNLFFVTKENGDFAIEVTKGETQTLSFSFVGMETIQRTYTCKSDQTNIKIMLREKESELSEVVVTGMFTRRAESFTGASTTFSQQDIINAGNQNIIKSLGNLDPSFQIFESLANGSDPNVMPTVQLRGQSTFPNLQSEYEGNPNQPLFILDGFEASIEKIFGLDLNRIASVTILKDAAAKAIYGSKAGNGVVVVETIRPKSGKLTVSYSGSLDLEIPDLTCYNLMNASEKLAFEKERGFYDIQDSPTNAQRFSQLYETFYSNIVKGVDTYWLSQPLRTGIGQKHSAILEGGDSRMRYQVGISYNNTAGVMKGSDRTTWNINSNLSYTYKNLIFRNTLEYTKNDAISSPYGTFGEYAALVPYLVPKDAAGNYVMELATNRDNEVIYNPLYNASLNTKLTSGYNEMRDNFSFEWRITDSWRINARASYTQQNRSSDTFYPSNHSKFATYDEDGISERKGRYTKSNGISQNFSADASINFNKSFGKHFLFANGTWNVSEVRSSSNSMVAEGFANDFMDNIAFASQYIKNGRPSGSDNHTREIGLIATANYSYDNRFLFDASLRASGSSMYGSNNRWGEFWSVGAGWNIHNEPLLRDNDWIKQFRIRSSFGYTGTQNFNPYQSLARYVYTDVLYLNRLGAQLKGLPNNDLRWQKVKDFNVGIDISVKNYLNLTFDYYISNTADMLSDITVAPSLGFGTYTENMGKIQNKGFDFMLSVTPWRNNSKRAWITLTANALHNNNKIKEISDIFKKYNEDELNNSKSSGSVYTLYYDGMSMSSIWGMRSLGIDPVTGYEWYLDSKGNSTNEWNSREMVIIGDSNPKLRGNIGINGGWKGFTFGISASYRFGGDLYNSTLVNKVENINGLENLDRRLFQSWANTGDLSKYKRITVSGGNGNNGAIVTQSTSRFIQKDNELYFSSINLGYDCYNKKILQHFGLERLSFTCYLNEILRLSSIDIERGTDYPFARNVSFAVRATF